MNRLAEAASPYLLQHRDNPVDWWEWSTAAFAEARRSNRPILLSIGYAACHWCHVMAHESFENPATAAVMNELFVNIKVDREERPDIDHVYMSALHSLGEQGGWPLTMFLTPEGDPFWGGTYFPPEPRHGRPSFTGVLRQISAIWQAEPERVAHNARAIRAALKQMESTARAETGEPDLGHLAAQIAGAFDPIEGGLRGAPKFPNAGLIELLWRRGTQDPAASAGLAAATLTLQRMTRGGIHDHLGGGFARYAVDERWLVPHFEKMLYDNAQLLGLYALEARRSGDPLAREAAEGIVSWLERDMLLPEGAFAASLDADSEGVEGKYYLWSASEITALLGPTEAAFLARHYDVSPGGNWEETNILNRLDTPDPGPAEAARLIGLKTRLLAERAKRIPPARDDKILADWNGLAIAALARAAGLLEQPHWLALAAGAYRFVSESMADGEGLAHSYRAGRMIRPGFALDHAAMIDAALALHDATFDPHYLSDARRLAEHLWRHYRDPDSGLIGMTRLESGELPVAPRPSHDDAVPNALGVHAANLVRIARKTGTAEDRERASTLMKAALGAAARAPMAHGSILNAHDLARNGVEIVLVGPKRAALHAAALCLPYTLVTLIDGETGDELPADHPAAAMLRHAGEAAAFICFEGRCLPPVTDPNRLADAIATGR